MRVVIDANVAAAALIRPDGWTAREMARADVEWVAPELLVGELREHSAEYGDKAGCSEAEWSRRVDRLAGRVRLVPLSALLKASHHEFVALATAVDPDDAVYLAALVADEADLLWTRDAALLRTFPGVAVTIVPHVLP